MLRNLFLRILILFFKDRFFVTRIKHITGFLPYNTDLFRIAFIHKSARLSIKDGSTVDNERLEFLGDAILDAVIAEYLYMLYPDKDEGFLTQLRSKIVKRKQLNKLAIKLGLAPLLKSNTNLNESRKNVLGNALEALIGAVYMDKGYRKTRKFIIDRILIRYLDLEKLSVKESDFKSRLIEWAQKNRKEITFISKEEFNTRKKEIFFLSNVMIMDQSYGTGSGSSKKEAEQKAAEQALLKVLAT